jgi:hypothetical protein
LAKRFTDTDKWKKNNFSELSIKMKLVWLYICDNCDYAGIWDANLKLLSFHIQEEVTKEELVATFGDELTWFSDRQIFIKSFIDFQYGDLNPENPVHKSILSKVNHFTKKKGLARSVHAPSNGAKEKEEEKDSLGGVGDFDFDALYENYPLKRGKAAGMKFLHRNPMNPEIYAKLDLAVKNYFREVQDLKTESRFIKHFSTFLGAKLDGPWQDYINLLPPRDLSADVVTW